MEYATNDKLDSVIKEALVRSTGDDNCTIDSLGDRFEYKLNPDYSRLYYVDHNSILYVCPFGLEGFNYKFLIDY